VATKEVLDNERLVDRGRITVSMCSAVVN